MIFVAIAEVDEKKVFVSKLKKTDQTLSTLTLLIDCEWLREFDLFFNLCIWKTFDQISMLLLALFEDSN